MMVGKKLRSDDYMIGELENVRLLADVKRAYRDEFYFMVIMLFAYALLLWVALSSVNLTKLVYILPFFAGLAFVALFEHRSQLKVIIKNLEGRLYE